MTFAHHPGEVIGSRVHGQHSGTRRRA